MSKESTPSVNVNKYIDNLKTFTNKIDSFFGLNPTGLISYKDGTLQSMGDIKPVYTTDQLIENNLQKQYDSSVICDNTTTYIESSKEGFTNFNEKERIYINNMLEEIIEKEEKKNKITNLIIFLIILVIIFLIIMNIKKM